MKQLGRYELVKRLAVGGMAELYLASASGPKGFKRRLVLKKILPQLADDPSFVEMFLGEARIAGRLDHPNIAQVYEVGEADGSYFIAMEHVDGPNLRTLAARARQAGQPLSPYLVAKIVSLACEGLGYAHEFCDPETGEALNIVHRDISPDNIIISRSGSVKVVDFGIAKAASQSHHTQTGVLKGKPAYMAPEQMARQRVDHRADIYALGVVLYELLSGARPHEARDDIELIRAVLLQEPMVPLSRRCPDLPGPLAAIVERALAREPDARYGSCRELQEDLERFLHGAADPIGARDIAKRLTDVQAEPTWETVPVLPAAPATPIGPLPEAPLAPTAVARPMATPFSQAPAARPVAEAPLAPARVARKKVLAAATAVAVAFVLLLAKVGTAPQPVSLVDRPLQVVAPPPEPSPSKEPRAAQSPPLSSADASKLVEKPVAAVRPRSPALTKEKAKVKILFRSLPEARVFVDGQQVHGEEEEDQDLTPIVTYVLEGEHQLRFECLNGVQDSRRWTVVPSAEQLTVDGRCDSSGE